MKVSLKKVKFTITRTQTMEIEVSAENGFDMPETLKEAIVLDDEIKVHPNAYVYDNMSWQLESTEVSEIEYE